MNFSCNNLQHVITFIALKMYHCYFYRITADINVKQERSLNVFHVLCLIVEYLSLYST